jgi:hypothetical protein
MSIKRQNEHIKMLLGARLTPILIVIVACTAVAPFLRSQNAQEAVPEIKIASQPYIPTDPNAIRVKSTMVPVTVVVRDANGQPIAGLT